MNEDRLDRYADLIVRVGANVQPAQTVYLVAEVSHLEVARAIAEKAYQAGALRVIPMYRDDHVRLSALRHAPLEGSDDGDGLGTGAVRALDDPGVALITLTGAADPHLFDGIDPQRLAAIPLELAQESVKAQMAGALAWTIAAAPNPGWATQVFGEPDVERLWDAVSIPLRLDEADVVRGVASASGPAGTTRRRPQRTGPGRRSLLRRWHRPHRWPIARCPLGGR